MTAGSGLTLAETRAEPALWGRLVESAVGAHLANAAAATNAVGAGARGPIHYLRTTSPLNRRSPAPRNPPVQTAAC